MRPPDLQPISERNLRAHLADTLDPLPQDDAYAERTEDDFGSVDDPYPDDFTDYCRAIELEGAL